MIEVILNALLPVMVAQDEAEMGFQEVAELLPVDGVTFAGRIPEEMELHTRFTAARAAGPRTWTWRRS